MYVWVNFSLFLLSSECLSVVIQGNSCGGIKASARGSWSRQSSWCSSSQGSILHCEWFKTEDCVLPNLLSDQCFWSQLTTPMASSCVSNGAWHLPIISSVWLKNKVFPFISVTTFRNSYFIIFKNVFSYFSYFIILFPFFILWCCFFFLKDLFEGCLDSWFHSCLEKYSSKMNCPVNNHLHLADLIIRHSFLCQFPNFRNSYLIFFLCYV